jgi:hypothetical protein
MSSRVTRCTSENICVDANLLALYRQSTPQADRNCPRRGPVNRSGVRAGAKIDAAIRDSGAFLDPRSRKDWWQGGKDEGGRMRDEGWVVADQAWRLSHALRCLV